MSFRHQQPLKAIGSPGEAMLNTILDPTNLKLKTIKLQTRLGNDIDNAQSFVISTFERSQFSLLDSQYKDIVTFRGNPTGIYNCHGLVFASRRTGIHNPQELFKILTEDGYEQVTVDKVIPGDIVLYFQSDGDIEHSGFVISYPDPLFKMPLILSKWGKYREAVHYANQGPYDKTNIRYYRVNQ